MTRRPEPMAHRAPSVADDVKATLLAILVVAVIVVLCSLDGIA